MNERSANKDPTTQRESFTELLGQLATNSAAMVHDEIELVIQGVREKVRAVRNGVLTVAAGAAIGFDSVLIWPPSLRRLSLERRLL